MFSPSTSRNVWLTWPRMLTGRDGARRAAAAVPAAAHQRFSGELAAVAVAVAVPVVARRPLGRLAAVRLCVEAVLGHRPVVDAVGGGAGELLEAPQRAALHLAGGGLLLGRGGEIRQAVRGDRRHARDHRLQVVADLVVARVQPGARGPAVDGFLLGRLDLLGAGEDAAGRDPAQREADVVGAAVEGAALGLHALRLEPLVEDVLDATGAGRAGGVRRRWVLRRVVAVAVIDAADVVRRREHVVVEHHVDLLGLGVAQRLGVVGGADQAVLLGAPPGEADLLAQVVVPVRDLLGLREQGRRAG